jgi:hypothetical protein
VDAESYLERVDADLRKDLAAERLSKSIGAAIWQQIEELEALYGDTGGEA